jgi:glycosyltransferase involved in cell wall biosynthesis
MFWIVGDGARREELENQVNALNLDNIVFTGRLARERMPEVISACDACLVHLRGTALFGTVIPSKIFEFMAMDVPIIMGVRGQARNFVLEAGAGVAMTPDDPRSLIDGLEQIRERGRDAFTGREYVRRHFNRDVLAGEMLRIIVVSD